MEEGVEKNCKNWSMIIKRESNYLVPNSVNYVEIFYIRIFFYK